MVIYKRLDSCIRHAVTANRQYNKTTIDSVTKYIHHLKQFVAKNKRVPKNKECYQSSNIGSKFHRFKTLLNEMITHKSNVTDYTLCMLIEISKQNENDEEIQLIKHTFDEYLNGIEIRSISTRMRLLNDFVTTHNRLPKSRDFMSFTGNSVVKVDDKNDCFSVGQFWINTKKAIEADSYHYFIGEIRNMDSVHNLLKNYINDIVSI